MRTVLLPCWFLGAVGIWLGGMDSEGQGKSFELVRDGVPQATIVLAKTPTLAAQFAAAELNYHIAKITGAALPIADDQQAVAGNRVCVGASRATAKAGLRNEDLTAQEYVIRFLPDALLLMGRDKADDQRPLNYADAASFPGTWDEQATCYAVYDFLIRKTDGRS